MREVIFNAETTGFDPESGHRLIEIACVELIDCKPTGRSFHTYLNPQRDVPDSAVQLHGLTTAFLKDKPLFSEKVEEFLDFIGGDQLVIHNAAFDMKFIDFEMRLVGLEPISESRVLDTLPIARNKFPGQPADLDALCERLGVDSSGYESQGVLLGAEILADIYSRLTDGKGASVVPGEGLRRKTIKDFLFSLVRHKEFFEHARTVLEEHPDAVCWREGETPLLHCAAEHGNIKVVEFLLERGVDIDMPDDRGRTPLEFITTCTEPDPDVVFFLLDHGASVNKAVGDRSLFLGTGTAAGLQRSVKATDEAISNISAQYQSSFEEMESIWGRAVGGDDMTLMEIDEAMERIRGKVAPDSGITFISASDPSLEGQMRVSVLVLPRQKRSEEKAVAI